MFIHYIKTKNRKTQQLYENKPILRIVLPPNLHFKYTH